MRCQGDAPVLGIILAKVDAMFRLDALTLDPASREWRFPDRPDNQETEIRNAFKTEFSSLTGGLRLAYSA